ncbi:MAG: chitobiase/beta-hexosaminidase C-terminal domain-containing protein [Muribaculaceae bacterium]|nr:chitobiase/beta-hexosaminidase C-terminal domain-containing protein [Muribaculaceae bacterium]
MKKLLLSLAIVSGAFGFASADNSADFNTFNSGKSNTSYGNYNTDSGWTTEHCAILDIDGNLAPTLNGKTSAVGVLTSPTLTGGIGTISFDYQNTYKESNGVSVQIDILQDNVVVKSETLTNTDVTQNTPYSYTSPALNVDGNFVIKITNLSPSNNSKSNKDRVSIYNLTWTSFGAGEEPSVATPSFEIEKLAGTGYVVKMSCETAGAEIYYNMSTEGSPADPDKTSTKYTAPVPVSGNTNFKAIAYVGDDASYVASYSANPPYVCADFEGVDQLNNGTKIELEGNIFGVYQNGKNLYVVDTKGIGMLLYNQTEPVVNNGDVIDGMEGTYSPYNGLPEISNYTLGTITAGTPIEPSNITLSDVNEGLINKYIRLNGLKITLDNGKTFTMQNAVGENLPLYNNFNIDVEEGENFTVTGFVSFSNTYGFQIYPTEISGGVVMETVATPTFEPASGELEANSEITIVCETEGATIYYTTDKSTPTAESNEYTGPITFTESMTVKAIAVKEGMLDSEVAEAVYTLYDPNAPVPTTVTFDFSDPDFLALNDIEKPASGGFDLCEKGSSREIFATGNNDPVVMVVEVEDNASTVARLWYSGEVRLYAHNTVTFKVNNVTRDANPETVTIQKIEFNDKASFEGSFSPDTYDASTKIWNGEDGAEGAEDFVISPSKSSKFTKAVVTLNTTTGVASIDNDNDATEVYYNLQGVRVARPENGLFIVVKGNKSKKVMF